jgi:diadenosine tetraphosphate (Ap4A) HIT family hydrolase
MGDDANFVLDTRLAADTLAVGDLPLSRVLLTNDDRFPWLVLVPRRPGLIELDDLPRDLRITLLDEIELAGNALRKLCAPDKLNVAALGNVVSQLHVHVIARFRVDPAWPRPVWGVGEPVPYPGADAAERISRLRARLGLN